MKPLPMSENPVDYASLVEINRLVHEPARLVILAILAGCESADFQFMLNATGLTKGNFSAQSIKLNEAGYISIEKGYNGRVPATRYSLTPLGRTALQTYSRQLRVALDQLS
jgi:DNA-binding transcriptional ArsR family regulator